MRILWRCACLASTLFWTVPSAAADTLAALGNSQLDYCGGSLAPLEGFAGAAKLALQTRQFKGSASFSAHLDKLANIGTHDFVLLTNQQGSWDSEGVNAVFASAEACHQRVVAAGGQTVLYLTYATGTDGSSSPQEMRVDEYLRYWEMLKTRLDGQSVNGKTSEAILVPVMQLWQEGKRRWPLDRNAGGDECDRGFMHDALHGGYRAQYATAALLYAYLTCEDPRPVAYQGRVDATFATWAKQRAWELASSFHRPKHCRAPVPDQEPPGPSPAGPDAGVFPDASPPERPRPADGAGGTGGMPQDPPPGDDETENAGGREGGGNVEVDPGPRGGANQPSPPPDDTAEGARMPSGCEMSPTGGATVPLWFLLVLGFSRLSPRFTRGRGAARFLRRPASASAVPPRPRWETGRRAA